MKLLGELLSMASFRINMSSKSHAQKSSQVALFVMENHPISVVVHPMVTVTDKAALEQAEVILEPQTFRLGGA